MKRPREKGSDESVVLDRREVEALLDAGRAASEPIDLSAALRSILDAALNLLEADEGSIQLLDPASRTLWIAAARGLPDDVVRTSRVPVGTGVSGRVAATGKAVLLSSAIDIEKFQGFIPKERKIHSAICVPLRARGAVIGVLSLDLMQPGPGFTDRDLGLARLFSDNAAHAIMVRQLLERAEKQVSETDTMRSASAALSSTLDLEDLADAILDHTAQLGGTGFAMLALGTETGPILLARYKGFSRDTVRTTLASSRFAEDFLTSPEPGLASRPLAESALAPLAAEIGEAEVLVLPALPPEDEHIGVLLVAISHPIDVKLRMLRSFAPEAALALGNALLHRRISTKERELDTIVSAVPLPIVLVDGFGKFRSVNPAAAEVFRLPQEFESGQPIVGKLTPEIESMLLARDEVMAKEVIVRIAGMPKAFRASVTGVRLHGGSSGKVLVLYDITAQRDLEQKKSDFLAVIGHELRTPLTAIRGFTSTVIRNGDALDATLRAESLQRVLGQAHRLERLIEDLLFVSRMDESRPPLHLSWDDAVTVCQDVVAEFRTRQPERTILFESPLPEMPVKMDRVKIEQILFHLIDNALKYSEPSTPVRVSVKQEATHVEVAVTDRGIGIYSGDLPRLFRAFGQLDGSATRRHGGTGVGLHVCKSLVDAYGGRIWADSVLGKGSTFTFTIPRVSPADAE